MTVRYASLSAAAALALVLGLLAATPARKRSANRDARHDVFPREVQPLLQKYCHDCHGDKMKGDLDLRPYTTTAAARKDRQVFERVLRNLQSAEMPPKNKPQPSMDERDRIVRWIERDVFAVDCKNPDPGRVTIRRLNRVEYNNTIRDLVGVDFQPAEDFPADDSGYGFDNIGDVLSLPPVLFEKYLRAADAILRRAIVTDLTPRLVTHRWPAATLDGTAPGDAVGDGARMLSREGNIAATVNFEHTGEYVLRARAYGQQAGPEQVKMSFSIDGKEAARFEVKAVERKPETYEARVHIEAGTRPFAAAYLNNYVNPKDPNPANRDRNLIIEYLEVVEPGPPRPPELPPTHTRIFFRSHTAKNRVEVARDVLTKFARRAYRRPVAGREIDRLMRLFEIADKQGESFEAAVKIALQAVLVSPHFLFRGEVQPDPDNPDAIHDIDEFALATRLSYFLWSTMPDDELFALAERRRLRRNLDAQVKRMLRDPKARALVDNFAGQWLQLRNLKLVAPDRKAFPAFDDELRAAMQQETELFFQHVLNEDRSVLEFLNADYSFVNERLAAFYGIPGVQGPEFRKVSTAGTPRGGILTQGSILTVTSNPTRTSPVKRGKWVLENLLGTPPPPPPPDVPELEEGKGKLTGTLRQRVEQHRDNPLCASCHERMDPIGFGLENFDAIGAWREKDGDTPVDPTGKLTTGEPIEGAESLKHVLATAKADEFTRCLTGKLLTYALGRGLEYYDQCAVDRITSRLDKDGHRFSTLISEIVRSVPFQKRRGDAVQLSQAAIPGPR